MPRGGDNVADPTSPRRAELVGVICALSCAFVSPCALAESGQPAPTRSYCRKIFKMPAFCQRDTRFGELPGGGEKYCAPVAVSNALGWLDANLCPGLLPPGETPGKAQFEMIRLLGSPGYMRTSPRRGSHPLDIMDGLATYCEERAYRAEIEWVGWSEGGPYTVGVTPEADWLASGVEGASNVILLVSLYSHDTEADVYSRRSGHYVTMTGYYYSGDGERLVYVQDPQNGAGAAKALVAYELEVLEEGALRTGQRGFPELSAAGLLCVGRQERDGQEFVALIDGAMRFRVVRTALSTRPGRTTSTADSRRWTPIRRRRRKGVAVRLSICVHRRLLPPSPGEVLATARGGRPSPDSHAIVPVSSRQAPRSPRP